jgi:hypothetical protein
VSNNLLAGIHPLEDVTNKSCVVKGLVERARAETIFDALLVSQSEFKVCVANSSTIDKLRKWVSAICLISSPYLN